MPRVALPNGETAEFPDTMAPADIEGVLQRQFPSGDAPSAPSGVGSSILAAITNPQGLPAFVAKSFTNPEGLAEHAASVALTAPLIAAGGAGAGALAARLGLKGGLSSVLAPIAGRVATSGAESAGKAALKGEDATVPGLAGAGVAAGTEGLLSLVTQGKIPKVPIMLKDLGAGPRAFEHARAAVLEALDAVRDRLPGIKFIVPAFGAGKLTPDEAAQILSKSTGQTYILGLSQLAEALNKAEKVQLGMAGAPKTLGMNAGQIFRRFTEPKRFEPKMIARGAEGLRRGLDSTATRSGLDALMAEDAEMLGMPGVPLGAIVGGGLWEAGKNRIPGLK